MKAFLMTAVLLSSLVSGCSAFESNTNLQLAQANVPRVAPAPQTNLPAAPAHRHVAAINGNISEDNIKTNTRAMFSKESAVSDVQLELKDTKWLKQQFSHDDNELADGSKVYQVTITGDVEWPFPGSILKNGVKKKLRAHKIVMAVAADTGRIVAASTLK